MPSHLLLIEDNPSDCLFVRGALDGCVPGQYTTTVAASLGEAKAMLLKHAFDAALLDLFLPDSEGLQSIIQLAAAAPTLPIVVLTGAVDASIAPEAVRCGAQDYLLKGQSDGTTITRAIQYAMDRKRREDELRKQRRELERKNQELQETQKRLEAYRDRYIDLYDFAPLGYVTLDQDGYVQELNLAGARLLGADRDALTGYPFQQCVRKDDVSVFENHVRECVKEHREVTSELLLLAKSGRMIAAQLHSVPVEGSEEGVTFCKTAITDITERKEMEEAIRHSHAFLQTVIDAIPDPILVIGRDYRIALANHTARQRSGEADMVSRCLPCYRVSHDRDAPCTDDCHPCPLRQTIASKAPVNVMHTHYDAEGREIFVEITAAPVFDAAGEVTHIIEACRDITDRKRAEDALVQERNLLQTLIDNLPDCIYVKDMDGRFIAANLPTASLMGVARPSDLLGKSDAAFYPPEAAARYRADEKELLRSRQPLVNQDEPRLDANGNLRDVLTTKLPLTDGQGRIVGLVGISRDITDRKPTTEAGGES